MHTQCDFCSHCQFLFVCLFVRDGWLVGLLFAFLHWRAQIKCEILEYFFEFYKLGIHHQALVLKRLRVGACFIEPPNVQWVNDFVGRHAELKVTQAQALDIDRHEAVSKGNIEAWFAKMEQQVNPILVGELRLLCDVHE